MAIYYSIMLTSKYLQGGGIFLSFSEKFSVGVDVDCLKYWIFLESSSNRVWVNRKIARWESETWPYFLVVL